MSLSRCHVESRPEIYPLSNVTRSHAPWLWTHFLAVTVASDCQRHCFSSVQHNEYFAIQIHIQHRSHGTVTVTDNLFGHELQKSPALFPRYLDSYVNLFRAPMYEVFLRLHDVESGGIPDMVSLQLGATDSGTHTYSERDRDRNSGKNTRVFIWQNIHDVRCVHAAFVRLW